MFQEGTWPVRAAAGMNDMCARCCWVQVAFIVIAVICNLGIAAGRSIKSSSLKILRLVRDRDRVHDMLRSLAARSITNAFAAIVGTGTDQRLSVRL